MNWIRLVLFLSLMFAGIALAVHGAEVLSFKWIPKGTKVEVPAA